MKTICYGSWAFRCDCPALGPLLPVLQFKPDSRDAALAARDGQLESQGSAINDTPLWQLGRTSHEPSTSSLGAFEWKNITLETCA